MKKHKQSHVRYTPKLKCNIHCNQIYEEVGSKVVGMVNKSQIVVKFHAFNGISASSFWWKRKLNKNDG